MATMGKQRAEARKWAESPVTYRSGWETGATWSQPAPRRQSRIEAAGHKVLSVIMAPLLVVLLVALASGWLE